MTPLERSISERAMLFAKENRTRIARQLACLKRYPADEFPVSVFMAGSPGAGKTEVSKSFIRLMEASGALDKDNRTAQIIYVYQKPELAWEFVLAREAIEGRNIPCNEFARQFYASKSTVCQLKREFQGRLQVDVLIKDTDGGDAEIGIDLSAEEIDELVRQPYHPDQLERILTGAAL